MKRTHSKPLIVLLCLLLVCLAGCVTPTPMPSASPPHPGRQLKNTRD